MRNARRGSHYGLRSEKHICTVPPGTARPIMPVGAPYMLMVLILGAAVVDFQDLYCRVALDNVMEQLSHSNCDEVKGGALTISKVDQWGCEG